MNCKFATTKVYDDYWRFAAERQAVYERRLVDNQGPWTEDPIIANYRFTNPYRAADRVSQYLIRDVQYGNRTQEPEDLFFRTILFKIFNKPSTWELIETQLGEPISSRAQLGQIGMILDKAFAEGQRIYSAAYIMPAPPFGQKRKHANHIKLIEHMMATALPDRLQGSDSLKSAYEMILAYPGIGQFLAFQYAIDFNYSTLMNHDEGEFVVAGPGALDGIAKCFGREADPYEVIMHMAEIQDAEFERLGLTFNGLRGRKLQPIDCQNLFCEISKYARIKHPDVVGTNGRTKIKQNYRSDAAPMPAPFFPPKWNI